MNKHEIKFKNTNDKMCLALIELLKKQDLDQISISELCAMANVNRSTFYAHYDSLGDLLYNTRNYIKEICHNEIEQQIGGMELGKIEGFDEEKVRELFLYPYLNVIKNHRDIFLIKEFTSLPDMFSNNNKNLLSYLFLPRYQQSGVDKNKIMYSSRFFFSGVDAVVELWLKNGCIESPEYIGDIIKSCILHKFE